MNAVLSNEPKRFQVWCAALILGCALLACSSPTTDAVPSNDTGKESTKLTTQASVSLSPVYVSYGLFDFASYKTPQIVLPDGRTVSLGIYTLSSTTPVVFYRGLNGTSLLSESFTFRSDPNLWKIAFHYSKDGVETQLPCRYQIDVEVYVPSRSGVIQFDLSKPKVISYYSSTTQIVQMPSMTVARSNCNGVIRAFRTKLIWPDVGPWLQEPWLQTETNNSRYLNVYNGYVSSFSIKGGATWNTIVSQ